MLSDEKKSVQLKIIEDMEVGMSLKVLKAADKPGLPGVEVYRVGQLNDFMPRMLTKK